MDTFNKNEILSKKVFDCRVSTLYNDNTNKPLQGCSEARNGERELAAMKSTGIIRKVDELGRIVLPIELRRTLDIEERDELEIFMENDRIILQKFEPACVFCGSAQGLITFRGKNVCRDCVKRMSDF